MRGQGGRRLSEHRLLGSNDVRALLAETGLRPTKQRGQNFVVEIGPGLGSLTLALLEVARHVTAVEVDPVLAARLPRTVEERAPGASFTLVEADAMRVAELPGPDPTTLVANLPYNVSVPVLLHFLETFGSIGSVLVMVQAEVAHRLAAPPGSRTYGVPSVKAAWYADVSLAGTVGRQVFWPVPNVDSALVSLVRRPTPGDEALRRRTFAVVDAAFAQRRKTLRAALAGLAGSPSAAEDALRRAGVDPQDRGERLDVQAFTRVAEALAAS